MIFSWAERPCEGDLTSPWPIAYRSHRPFELDRMRRTESSDMSHLPASYVDNEQIITYPTNIALSSISLFVLLIGPGAPGQPDSGARVELRVVVSPETLQVQRGRTVELTCTVYGGDASTSIYWIQDEPERVRCFARLSHGDRFTDE